MFDFLKNNKEDGVRFKKTDVSCICTLNKYGGRHGTAMFKDEFVTIKYEEGEVTIYYKDIVSCGEIINDKMGIKEAMNKNILTQAVLQSPGFLVENFYSFTNSAKAFLYIKFKEERESIQTFLMVYNFGAERVAKFIEKQKKKIK